MKDFYTFVSENPILIFLLFGTFCIFFTACVGAIFSNDCGCELDEEDEEIRPRRGMK